MIISNEQAQKAIEYLQIAKPFEALARGPSAAVGICPEFLGKVCRSLMELPEAREDRIQQARQAITVHSPASAVVAEKMIARLLSDSLR